MSDIRKLVEAIKSQSPTAAVKFKQGSIVSVEPDGTATITLSGSDVQIPGVKVASHVCPVPGVSCWVATDGMDLFIHSTLNAPLALVRAERTTNQTLATAEWTAITLADVTDPYDMHASAASTITVPVPGFWSVTATVVFAANATNYRHMRLMQGANAISQASCPAMGTQLVMLSAATHVQSAIGDTFSISAYQNSGGSLAIEGAALTAVWVSP